MFNISEIQLMDTITSLEDEMHKKSSLPIVNVSHWDSSKEFQRHMLRAFTPPEGTNLWEYWYTYSFSNSLRQRALADLGLPHLYQESARGIFFPSSTIAIVNLINLLSCYGYKKLCILKPAYFSVESCCHQFSLPYSIEQISFENNTPVIPINSILAGNYDCVWITSPIYSTSYYYDENQISMFANLQNAGITLIFDESLALPEKELIRQFPITDQIFFLYSPHKAISINGLKFSVVVCSKKYEDFLDQWVDILAGGLGVSNRDAVHHYISTNYRQNCVPAYYNYININKERVLHVVKQFSKAWVLPGTCGHYITIFTQLNISKETELINILATLIRRNFVSFFPGSLNGMPSQMLSFRVNLTGGSQQLPGLVGEILTQLNA